MGSKSSKVRGRGAENRTLWAQEAETPFVTKLSSEDLKMYRANEYDTQHTMQEQPARTRYRSRSEPCDPMCRTSQGAGK